MRGVTIDDLLRAAGLDTAPSGFLMAHCDGGYTTNLLLADLIEARAMIATHFEDLPLLGNIEAQTTAGQLKGTSEGRIAVAELACRSNWKGRIWLTLLSASM